MLTFQILLQTIREVAHHSMVTAGAMRNGLLRGRETPALGFSSAFSTRTSYTTLGRQPNLSEVNILTLTKETV